MKIARTYAVLNILLFVLLAARVQAQIYTGPIPVHQTNGWKDGGSTEIYPGDHPDRLQYDNPSQWPTDDFQQHWGAPGVNDMFHFSGQFGVADMPCHAHIQLNYPRYGELRTGQTIQMKMSILLFHCDAFVTNLYISWWGGASPHDVVWEDTGTSTPPEMVGDPMGLKQWNVSFQTELDPANPYQTHGWTVFVAEFQLNTHTQNDPDHPEDHDTPIIKIRAPMYALTDPDAPELDVPPQMLIETDPINFTAQGEIGYGAQIVELNQFWPTTTPIARPWAIQVGTQGYGGTLPDPNQALLIYDADIHHGIDGLRVVDHVSPNRPDTNNVVPAVVDPATLCGLTPPAAFAPKHKILIVRSQPDTATQTESAALIALTVSVDCAHLGQTVTVPNIVGQSKDAALAALRALGLDGSFSTANSAQPAGVVISQQQPAGSQVSFGSTVNFVISAGQVVHQIVITTTPLTVSGKQITIDGIPQPVQICVGDPNVPANCKPF
jgi:hypothetical protein